MNDRDLENAMLLTQQFKKLFIVLTTFATIKLLTVAIEWFLVK